MAENKQRHGEDVATTLGLDRVSGPWRLWRWILALCSVAAAVVVFLVFDADNGNGFQYKTVEVRRGALTVTVTATGTLEPTNQVDVGSELSGIVRTIDADFNDEVKIGQVLARLDTDMLEAQVLKSRAALEAADAKVLEAQATVLETRHKFQRCERLAASKMCSQEDIESAEAAFKRAQAAEASARASVSQARASLDADRTKLAKAVIHSPINGVVLVRAVEPGQTVAASLQAPVLFTLAEDLSQMELHVDVDEADVGLVEQGQLAVFSVDAYPDRSFPARITQVRYGAQEVDGVITYETVLEVDNSDLVLRPGMTVTADITVKEIRDAVLVPNAALRFTPAATEKKTSSGGSLVNQLMPRPPRLGAKNRETPNSEGKQQRVWTLKNGQPTPLPVTTGATNGIVTEILSGAVEPGMTLVVEQTRAGR